MIVIDEKLLEEFRATIICEWCGRHILSAAHPHHIYARGMGGGSRLDVRENLIALCFQCHGDVHAGLIARDDLWGKVAARENCLQGTIKRKIARLLRKVRKA